MGKEVSKKKTLKVCGICGESFWTEEEWRDACPGCNYKPMYPDNEAANEALGH